MARFSRQETLLAMKEIGLVPVFTHPDPAVGARVVAACADGGARAIEFTNRGEGAYRAFSELIVFCRKERPEVILGVGSVVDAPTAALFIGAGADFVVGPVLDEEIAFLCNTRKVPYCPGCGSATEIQRAHRLGVEICKVFPGGEVGGPGFVKGVRGPMPWAELMPTGGVDPTEQSLAAWFNAGVACVGIGSNLVTKDLVEGGRFDELTKKVRETIEIIRRVRTNKK
jgi:2-dehydro-3-deoxyphosphogluconate aldolase/(4S)-4-hydroxy-2-oxoglutarate aldolase